MGSGYRSGALLDAGSSRVASVPAQTGRANELLSILIRVALAAALAAGGWWAYRTFLAGFPFPETVAGEPRLDSQEAEALSDATEAIFRVANVDTEMVIYGEDALEPAYGIIVMDIPTDPIDAVRNGGQVTDYMDFDLEEEAFHCESGAQVPFSAICIWPQDDDTAVMVAGSRMTGEELRPVAEGVRNDVS